MEHTLYICPNQDASGLGDPLQLVGEVDEVDPQLLSAGAAADVFICNALIVKKVLRVSPSHFNHCAPEQGDDILSEFCESFCKRIIAWSQLVHLNIARVWPSQSALSFYQERCEQGDLRAWMKQDTNSHSICYSIIEGILNGLTYLHNHNPAIIHGSLNPGKIFVTSDSNSVKIGEFGLAESMTKFSHIAPAVSFNGIVRWTSPEQLQLETDDCEERVSVQSDMRSFGCTIFEVLTGDSPYSRYKYDPKVVRAIIKREPPGDLARVKLPQSACASFLQDLVRRCWNDPQDRPSSTELLKELNEHKSSNHPSKHPTNPRLSITTSPMMPPLVVRVGHSSPTESHANPDEFSSDKSVSSIEQAMALSHSDMAIPRATRLETHSVPRNVTAPSGEVSSSVMNSLFIGNFKPSGDDVTSLGIPHQSPTILVTPPVAGSSTGPDTAQSPQRHRHQGVSVSGPKEKKRWFCEPCNSGPFFRKAEFDRHMKTSKAHKRHRSYEPEFQCNKCGRKFTSADAKMGHEKLCESEGKGEERESEGSEE